MSRRGPPPTPNRIKELRGTLRADRKRNAPEPRVEAPNCPTWLSREGKAEWRRIVPELEAIWLVATIDRALLAGLCECWSTWVACEKVIREEGRTFRSPNGHICQRPEVAIGGRALKDLTRLGAEFGLSPSARSRLEVRPLRREPRTAMQQLLERDNGDNPWEEFG